MCLDHSAHGVVSTHEVFQRPYAVQFEWTEIPTPESYSKYYNGRELVETMRAWRVQEKGYRSTPGYSPGVVAGYWGFEDSPDAEILAGGVNSKGPRYPALARHGNFFLWGFSAAPSEMTESARRAFVNSVCYMRGFDRQPPVTRTNGAARGYLLDRALQVANLEKNYERLLKNHERRAAIYKEIKALQESGEKELTEDQKWVLKRPVGDPITWERYQDIFMRGMPDALFAELGKSPEGRAKYLSWFESKLDYLYLEDKKFHVDEVARSWGIPNRDPRILEHAVSLLESGQDAEKARAVLGRYTDQSFDRPKQWRAWLDANAAELFFSDYAGFRFVSRRLPPEQERKSILAREAPKPTPQEPVLVQRHVIGTLRPGSRVTLAVRMDIAQGWHTYADVPPGSAYPRTQLKLELPAGVRATSDWQLPKSSPSADDPAVLQYENSVVFLRRLRIGEECVPGSKITVTVSWQACDLHMCLPPDEKKLELTIRR